MRKLFYILDIISAYEMFYKQKVKVTNEPGGRKSNFNLRGGQFYIQYLLIAN